MNGAASAGACLVSARAMRDTQRSLRAGRDPAPAIGAAGALGVRFANGQQVWIRETVDTGMLRTVLEGFSRSLWAYQCGA